MVCDTPAAMTDSIQNRLQVLLLPLLFSLRNGVDGRRGAIAAQKGVDEIMPSLRFLSLSNNKLNGAVPVSVFRLQSLEVLDLSGNNFSGSIPDCAKISHPLMPGSVSDSLQVINLSHNSLSGAIPSFLFSLLNLQYLQLNGNRISGEFPSQPWKDCCSNITILDLGENNISGTIPSWIAERMPNLKILRLHSNNLTGGIPLNLASLKYLQVLDLANNNLAGHIPLEFGNFAAMKTAHNMNDSTVSGRSSITSSYTVSINIVTKGKETVYDKILLLVVSMDLSNNRLSGVIPQEVAGLVELQTLNVSWNNLSGHIIKNIDKLHNLETLDLSKNKFSGEIQLLSSLTSLNHLNLSFNNFSGEIPQENQFNTFNDPSIFMNNPYLCGPPLNKTCKEGRGRSSDHRGRSEGHQSIDMVCEYLFTALGFILGFWVVCGTLVMHRRWRAMFFIFLDGKFGQLFESIKNLLARRFKTDD